MKTSYEGALFYTSLSSSIEKNLIKQRLKKAIGPLLGKPYETDPYLSFAEKCLAPVASPVIVDVGANIGTTVLPLAKKYPHARFFAVEPHPVPAGRFIQNCELNHVSNVSLVNAAIAPASQFVKIYTCPSNSGGHRITGFEGRTDIGSLPKIDHISILSISLHSLFSHFDIAYCDLLKIDVEGFECQVLESLENLLTPQKVGTIVVEYGPEGMKKAGKTGWDMVKMMLGKGFQCMELKTQRPIATELDIPHLPDFTVTDFVFYSQKL